MPRLTPIDVTTATGKAKELPDEIQEAFGSTPNALRTMASIAAPPRGLAAARTRALDCPAEPPAGADRDRYRRAEPREYCLSAHATFGRLAGLDAYEIERNR